MTMWVANKSVALREQCGPFISLLLNSATVWLRDFQLCLIAIYMLMGTVQKSSSRDILVFFMCMHVEVLSVLHRNV